MLIAPAAENGETLIEQTWPGTDVADVPAALAKAWKFLRAEIGMFIASPAAHS